MTKTKIELPKVYENENGNYPQYLGRPKLSYSQYTSFKDDLYRGRYISNYFMGIPDPGNIFSDYGGKCGEYLEKQDISDLSEFDREVLDSIHTPENSRFEVEVVVDMLPLTGVDFVMQGFIDRESKTDHGLYIIDFKTGNHTDKAEYYASEEYGQTTLYSFVRESEGEEIAYSGVILFERKGNGMEKYPLRLSGEVKEIETPYSKERAMKLFDDIAKVTVEISDYYKLYKKYFTDGGK